MKKGLSAVLAASLAFSAFGSVAFAADSTKDLTALEKFQELVKEGIFDPEGAGNGADLEALTTRAQIAKILVKLLRANEDASAEKFDDVEADDWFAGYVGALQKAKLIDGVSDEPPLFAPNDNVTIEQFAKLVAIALDLDIDANAEVEGEVSEWAKGYVAAVVKAGYLAPQEDYTAEATREVLVTSAFAANEIIKEIEEAKNATKISSFAAVGAKKLEVKFSKAVDKSKATISVKKGTIPVNIAKTTFSEDNKSAVIETVSNLTKGEYTVTVSGVEATALEAKVSVEDEKVTKIEFIGDKAPLSRGDDKVITAKLKVYNQYNEDVTKSQVNNNQIQVNSGYQTTTVSNDGTVTITSLTPFMIDTKVAVSAVHKTTGTYASATYTVATKAQVASLAFDKLYNANGKTEIEVGSSETFYLLLNAKDQFGNTVTTDTYLEQDTVVNVTNTSVISVNGLAATGQADYEELTIDGVKYAALKLTAPSKSGTSQVFVYSKATGQSASFEVTVKDSSKIDTLTLEAPDLVVGGETVELPYTALDQFGKDVTSLNGFTDLNVSVTQGTYSFEKDYVNNKVKFKYTAPSVTEATTVYMTVQTKTYKFVQLQLTVQPNKKPQVISGVDELKYALAPGATTTISRDKIKVLDQYGRTKTLANFAGYEVQISKDNANVEFDGSASSTATVDAATTSVKLKGSATANGSTNFTLKLVNEATGETVANSEYTFSARTVKRTDITGYEVADIAKLYANGNTAHAKALDVVGLLADGTKVAIPDGDTSYYNVTTVGVAYDSVNDTVYAPASLFTASESNTEKSFKVIIHGSTNNGAQVIEKTVVASNVGPAATTLTLRNQDNDIIVSQGEGYVTVAAGDARNARSDASGALVGTGNDATGVGSGYSYTITAVAANGNSIVFKVIVQ
ncbi:S-layer homology domain-containing protein [Paenibacillus thermoaerophilus]|uniref:S-layer homology domain-containing protein n=1 Tax=Paenibacillus thermoaerophilus TaxID=1215385 RepID=A0ABW2V968_9BACL|nr:S-layer homology domain-containing protein [Paenibacillus thermoaerophilus]